MRRLATGNRATSTKGKQRHFRFLITWITYCFVYVFRSEGRLRNVWQRRKCQAREGFLEIYHADETKPPTRVNLLTCQMKPVPEERQCFDVVSYNRTYHFQVSSGNKPKVAEHVVIVYISTSILQAENESDKEEWMSVLLNSKDRALNQAFQDNGPTSNANQSFLELRRALVTFIRNMPGNDKCCDCGSQNGKNHTIRRQLFVYNFQ